MESHDPILPAPSAMFAVGMASAVVLALSVGALVYRSTNAKVVKPQPLGAAKKRGSELSVEDLTKPLVRLLYGTQTGTAERFSKQLAAELRKKYGSSTVVDVVDLENYSAEQQLHREKLIILCVATYGDGEPTDNAADFFSWIGQEADAVEAGDKPAPLENVSYAVFGLGNKQYEHFNAMGKKAHKALGAMGARPLVRRGDGDDDVCIDEDFDKWSTELFEALDGRPDLVGAEQSADGVAAAAAVLPAYEVEQLQGVAEDMAFPVGGTGKDHHSPYWATISAARELHTAISGRSCVHVELDIGGASASYEAGDHVALHAANSPAIVEEVGKLLGFELDQVVRLSVPKDGKGTGLAPPPEGALSVRSLLAWHADLLSPPHREALDVLARHTQDAAQAARFARLASTEGKQEYTEWISRPQRSLLEVLRELPSARPPLGVFMASVAPRLQPRFYSISSSSRMHPRHVHITCAVVKQETATGRVHEGVASSWLQRQLGVKVGGKVPVFLRSSHFKLPRDPSKPVVMVGPGTGLAPFRGFLQERAALRNLPKANGHMNGSNGHMNGVNGHMNGTNGANGHVNGTGDAAAGALGPAVLFFGCRSRTADYIYEEELAAHLKGGELTALHVAFSREGAAKDYVQHHLEREAQEVWRMLEEQGGSLYVCGDAKHMAKDVHRALVALVSAAKACSGTQAEAWVKQLQDSGRYQRDVW